MGGGGVTVDYFLSHDQHVHCMYLLVEVSCDAIVDPLLCVVAGPPLSFLVATLTASHQLEVCMDTRTHTGDITHAVL